MVLPGEAGGWALGSLGAAANAVTVLRRSAWVLLLTGPALGAWSLLAPPDVVVGTTVPERDAAAVVDSSAGPSGFAELFVSAYLEAGEGTEGALTAFLPGAESVVLSADPGSQVVEQAAAVRVRAVSDGYWAVTVAARVRPVEAASTESAATQERSGTGAAVLRYFRVPVRSGPSGALAAVSLPAEVGAPALGKAPALVYGRGGEPSEADAGVRTLGGFFGSYLAGDGELDRYMSPGSTLTSIGPAPYTSVSLVRIAEYGTNAPGAAFPEGAEIADGTRRRLLVDVAGVDRAGVERPLTYAIALKARDGRWEVEAVEAAPLLVSGGSGVATEGDS
ncbi:conjugal transfer protein [Streptomyces sp. SBC-4]|nr:conjugal transfer protein [Streptomyces sp. SBC-4]MDV5143262.1 conjugal transfer protein [Streptomyces sp. SBC-4]